MQSMLERLIAAKWLIAALALFALTGGGAFASARWLLSDSAEAARTDGPGPTTATPMTEPPGPDVTPAPGSTPDRSKSGWPIPYLNQERLAPKFHGVLAGLEFGVDGGPVPSCAGLSQRLDWKAAIAGTEFDIPTERLPGGAKLVGTPRVFACSDGEVQAIIAEFAVGAGAGGESPRVETVIEVARWRGVTWWPNQASASRWSTGTLSGRPAVFLDEVLPGYLISQSAVFVPDPEIRGSTRIYASSGTLEFAQAFAEALYQ